MNLPLHLPAVESKISQATKVNFRPLSPKMVLVIAPDCNLYRIPRRFTLRNPKFNINRSQLCTKFPESYTPFPSPDWQLRRRFWVCNSSREDSSRSDSPENEVNTLGVKVAISMLKFYKREISPLLPKSCRYVPTCSEYSMIAYRKYGVVKGTMLTAWRVCRCNPLGGSGFDPPRWFDENTPPDE